MLDRMSRSDRRGASWRLLRTERVPLAVAALLLLAVVVADLLTGDETVFVSLLITAPLVVAAFTRPAVTAGVGVAAAVLATVLVSAERFATPNHLIRILAITSGSTLAVFIAARREQRERALVEMTVVADVAQNAVLWPVPRKVGDLTLASRYVSASAAARIGGDLYEVADTEHGVRLIMGDVRGKGLAAVRLASAVLGCFREVAHTRQDLSGVHEALEATVRRIAAPEDFVTVILVELAEDRASALACGHPAPLLIHEGKVSSVPVEDAGLPLGLGSGSTASGSFCFPPGARLLLHTDGLLEGRDTSGRFFPVAEQVDVLCSGDVDACLDGLLDRLRDHCGGHISDDVALLLVQKEAVRSQPASPPAVGEPAVGQQ